jgi:hypothetical protein
MTKGVVYNSNSPNRLGLINKDNWQIHPHPNFPEDNIDKSLLYSAIEPNSGEYVIYSPKPDGTPSIHKLNSDSELITFTNRFYNNNFTSVAQCLEFYRLDPNLMCINKPIEQSLYNELILKIDPADSISYPQTGNTVYDLSGNQNHMQIKNNPDFQQYYFRFDPNNNEKGVIESSAELDFGGGSISVCAWVRERNNAFGSTYWNVVSKYNQFILGPNGDGVMAFLPNLKNGSWRPNSYSDPDIWNNVYNQSNFDHTKFHYYAGVYNKNNGKIQLYIDAILVAEHNENTSGLSADSDIIQIAKRDSSGNYFDGDIGGVHIYNRPLTSSEIQTNYDATKSEYI